MNYRTLRVGLSDTLNLCERQRHICRTEEDYQPKARAHVEIPCRHTSPKDQLLFFGIIRASSFTRCKKIFEKTACYERETWRKILTHCELAHNSAGRKYFVAPALRIALSKVATNGDGRSSPIFNRT